MENLAKILIIIGIILILAGFFIFLLYKLTGGLFGNLPGDIKIEKDNFKFYFPLASSIILSIILTVILTIIVNYFLKR